MILNRFIREEPLDTLAPVASREDILAAQDTFRETRVSEPVRAYIVALCEKTRTLENVSLGVSPAACWPCCAPARRWPVSGGAAL